MSSCMSDGYFKFRYASGARFYMGQVRMNGKIRRLRRVFRRASDAMFYGRAVAARYNRFSAFVESQGKGAGVHIDG